MRYIVALLFSFGGATVWFDGMAFRLWLTLLVFWLRPCHATLPNKPFCSVQQKAPALYWRCPEGFLSLAIDHACDGLPQCPSKEDEDCLHTSEVNVSQVQHSHVAVAINETFALLPRYDCFASLCYAENISPAIPFVLCRQLGFETYSSVFAASQDNSTALVAAGIQTSSHVHCLGAERTIQECIENASLVPSCPLLGVTCLSICEFTISNPNITSGSISSPGYPRLLPNLECAWMFRAAPGHVYVLNFLTVRFHDEDHTGCKNGHIEIFAQIGDDDDSRVKQRLCDDSLVNVTGSLIVLRSMSGPLASAIRGPKGFLLSYTLEPHDFPLRANSPGISDGALAGIIVGVFIAGIFAVGISYCIYRKCKQKHNFKKRAKIHQFRVKAFSDSFNENGKKEFILAPDIRMRKLNAELAEDPVRCPICCRLISTDVRACKHVKMAIEWYLNCSVRPPSIPLKGYLPSLIVQFQEEGKFENLSDAEEVNASNITQSLSALLDLNDNNSTCCGSSANVSVVRDGASSGVGRSASVTSPSQQLFSGIGSALKAAVRRGTPSPTPKIPSAQNSRLLRIPAHKQPSVSPPTTGTAVCAIIECENSDSSSNGNSPFVGQATNDDVFILPTSPKSKPKEFRQNLNAEKRLLSVADSAAGLPRRSVSCQPSPILAPRGGFLGAAGRRLAHLSSWRTPSISKTSTPNLIEPDNPNAFLHADGKQMPDFRKRSASTEFLAEAVLKSFIGPSAANSDPPKERLAADLAASKSRDVLHMPRYNTTPKIVIHPGSVKSAEGTLHHQYHAVHPVSEMFRHRDKLPKLSLRSESLTDMAAAKNKKPSVTSQSSLIEPMPVCLPRHSSSMDNSVWLDTTADDGNGLLCPNFPENLSPIMTRRSFVNGLTAPPFFCHSSSSVGTSYFGRSSASSSSGSSHGQLLLEQPVDARDRLTTTWSSEASSDRERNASCGSVSLKSSLFSEML